MVAPTFTSVDSDAGCTLADLKVTGYTAPSKNNKGKWTGGCTAGKFAVSKLNTSGISEGTYHWLDTGTIGPGWFADIDGGAIAGGAESVTIDAGRALWTQGSAYRLVPAGAVNTKDLAYTTVLVGKVAVGNGTPVDLTLADLTVTGYTAPSKNNKGKWSGGCTAGKFAVSKLNASGISEGTYHWLDTGVIGPGWFADIDGAAIDGGADSIAIPAGKGLWTQGSGYILNIPAPEL